MPGLASARPPAPLVEILDLIDAFAPEALISVAAGGRKKPRNPMPVPMVDQPCKIGVQVHDRGPVSQPWIGLSHAYSSLFFVSAGSNYTLNWCPPQAKRDRKSVVWGKSGYVREDLGGRTR